MKNKSKGFALVEVVIVIVLLSGSLLVFLEALSQAKSLQIKSEIITIQSFLIHDKINELRSINYEDVENHNFYASYPGYPNYSFLYTVSYLDDNLNIVNYTTELKQVDLSIKHNNSAYNPLIESFVITNL